MCHCEPRFFSGRGNLNLIELRLPRQAAALLAARIMGIFYGGNLK